ncbi:MAG TPA: response regulator transcription factor [Miltoncostaea sp.]|nr:response regulator transcription factor [Miltoncostaea sp.]
MTAPGRGRPVLVVDDEPHIVRALTAMLTRAGYAVHSAASAGDALQAAALRTPAAILLDLRLPDGDGVDVCRRIRDWSDAPILVVSAWDDEEAKIDALDAGADDFVTKPFSAPELLARLRAAIRRSEVPASADAVVPMGDVTVDLERRLVLRGGERVHLTVREYELLARLARDPGRVLTHAALLRHVWGPAYEDDTHLLRVHMANLRKKLEAEPASPRHLVTESGIGYRLQPSGG